MMEIMRRHHRCFVCFALDQNFRKCIIETCAACLWHCIRAKINCFFGRYSTFDHVFANIFYCEHPWATTPPRRINFGAFFLKSHALHVSAQGMYYTSWCRWIPRTVVHDFSSYELVRNQHALPPFDVWLYFKMHSTDFLPTHSVLYGRRR